MKKLVLARKLLTLVARAQRRSLGTYKVATFNAAKYLQQLNFDKLNAEHKPTPEQDKKEFFQNLQRMALDGPVFPSKVIDTLRQVPFDMDKNEIKWFANQLMKQQGDTHYNLPFVLDWARGTGTDISRLSYDQAFKESQHWHEHLKGDGPVGSYKTKKVVSKLSDGFTIVAIEDPDDLEVEGNLMGHCVGTYCDNVSSGHSKIFSLRDSKNQPHVTIEAQEFTVTQIYGKENQPPVAKYQKYILAWFLSEPKLKHWARIVSNWEIARTPEYQEKITEYLNTDPHFLMTQMQRNGFNVDIARNILKNGDETVVSEMLAEFAGDEYMTLISPELLAFGEKAEDLMLVEVASALHGINEEGSKKLYNKALASKNSIIVLSVRRRAHDYFTNSDIVAALLTCTDEEAPDNAYDALDYLGDRYAKQLQPLIEKIQKVSILGQFYTEYGDLLDLDSMLGNALTIEGSRIKYAIIVNPKLELTPKQYKQLIYPIVDEADSGFLFKIVGGFLKSRNKKPEVLQLFQDAILLRAKDDSSAGMWPVLSELTTLDGTDRKKISKFYLENADLMPLSGFISKMVGHDIEGIPYHSLVERYTSIAVSSQEIVRLSQLFPRVDKKNVPVEDLFMICLEGLMELEEPAYVVNALTAGKWYKDKKAVEKVQDYVFKVGDYLTMQKLVNVADMDLLDGKKIENMLFDHIKKHPEADNYPLLVNHYTRMSDADPKRLEKYVDGLSDMKKELYSKLLEYLDKQKSVKAFVRIASGLRKALRG
jgi:hypothetical protein